MKAYYLMGALCLAALAGCDLSTGVLSESNCKKAQDGMMLADASIAEYKVKYPNDPLPATIVNNYATARALVAVVCPVPAE